MLSKVQELIRVCTLRVYSFNPEVSPIACQEACTGSRVSSVSRGGMLKLGDLSPRWREGKRGISRFSTNQSVGKSLVGCG